MKHNAVSIHNQFLSDYVNDKYEWMIKMIKMIKNLSMLGIIILKQTAVYQIPAILNMYM